MDCCGVGGEVVGEVWIGLGGFGGRREDGEIGFDRSCMYNTMIRIPVKILCDNVMGCDRIWKWNAR